MTEEIDPDDKKWVTTGDIDQSVGALSMVTHPAHEYAQIMAHHLRIRENGIRTKCAHQINLALASREGDALRRALASLAKQMARLEEELPG